MTLSLLRGPRRARVALAATAAVTMLVTACGSGGSSDGPSASAEAAGFPVSITSALGTAEIKTAPKRVVTLG